jgi:hypothetical protein
VVPSVKRFLKDHSDDSFGTAKKQNRQDTEELKEC